MREVLANAIVVIILQHINASNQQPCTLNFPQGYMSIISQFQWIKIIRWFASKHWSGACSICSLPEDLSLTLTCAQHTLTAHAHTHLLSPALKTVKAKFTPLMTGWSLWKLLQGSSTFPHVHRGASRPNCSSVWYAHHTWRCITPLDDPLWRRWPSECA